MNKVSDNIKKFRELKNLTREQMASELGMSLSGYSKIERGEIDLTISKVYKIAEVLKVEVPQILNFDAAQIFNVSNNNNVNGIVVENVHVKQDEYREKYIKMLEMELSRLSNLNAS